MENQKISGGRKPHLVFYPFIGMGHVIPFARLASRMVTCYGFSVTFITIKWEVTHRLQTAYLEALVSSNSEIRVWELPCEVPEEIKYNLFALSEKSLDALEECLESLVEPRDSWPPARAFITDFFHVSALQLSSKLRLPAYIFITTSAAFLCVMLYTPKLVTQESFLNDSDAEHHIPGVRSPISRRDFPPSLKSKSSPMHDSFVRICSGLPESAGILVNTFYGLESHALDALHSGKLLERRETPPIHAIGPVLSAGTPDGGKAAGEGRECLEWLHHQPEGSVIYVSFGSLGLLSSEQTAEMASGLERSRQRFLWILRGVRPPTGIFPSTDEPDLDAILPDGFRERVKERGLVVSSWAPQMAILSHCSVGGFVCHCGWNSTLEGVWCGVPMVAWPLHAEQQMNSLLVVEEWQVGLAVCKDEEGMVRKEEVERVARELMEGQQGRVARTKMKDLSKLARDSIADNDGTSVQSLNAAILNFTASK